MNDKPKRPAPSSVEQSRAWLLERLRAISTGQPDSPVITTKPPTARRQQKR